MERLFIFLHCVTAFKQKYDVKIEHKSSNETVFNEFSITLDNSNNISNDSTRSEPTLNYLTNTDIIHKYYIPPFIHRKRNNEEIKKELDKFALQRKISHITPVQFSFDVPNLEPTFKERKRNTKEINDKILKETKYISKTSRAEKKFIRELEDNKISQEIKLNNIFKRPEIDEVLKRQNELVDRLVRLLKVEKKSLRTNFNTLIEEMEKLKNQNVTQKQEVIQGPLKPATVVNIDETMVREALKNDPFVRRVLQMGKSKRDAYEREARIYNKG